MNAPLYQCPYEKATKCAQDEPCKGCETWAKYHRELDVKENEEQVKAISMIEKRSIDEFREAGLLLLTNQFLHIFGWALTVEINDDDGNVTKFYPAYCKFRGFDNDTASDAYVKITKHLEKRLPDLLKDIEA